jgi:hypothetical protein
MGLNHRFGWQKLPTLRVIFPLAFQALDGDAHDGEGDKAGAAGIKPPEWD